MISPEDLSRIGAEGVLPETLVDLAQHAWTISEGLVMSGDFTVNPQGRKDYFTTIRYSTNVYRLQRTEGQNISVRGVRLDGATGEALSPLIPLTLSQAEIPSTEDTALMPLSPVPVGIVAQELGQGVRVPDSEYDDAMAKLQRTVA